jgi:metal-sulfur cluster biosynthetic enzyme
LTLAVQAADLYTFGNGPNIGSGESWQLDVVTEDELVTRLEARELLIKQRYEQIVEEMTETRNLLLKMDFTPPGKVTKAAPKAKQPGAEPGDRPEETPQFSIEELNKRRLERTLQALQNCRKNALETADIAAAIEEIRLQLDNNQANNETRKQRIETRVLQPLRKIVDIMFPVLDRDLEELKKIVDNLSDGPVARDVALKQADQILELMRDVLDHMMKTEDFNINVVQRLKKIIERQRELTQRTKNKEEESLGDKE